MDPDKKLVISKKNYKIKGNRGKRRKEQKIEYFWLYSYFKKK